VELSSGIRFEDSDSGTICHVRRKMEAVADSVDPGDGEGASASMRAQASVLPEAEYRK
jgi:hypothetical protein